MAGPFSFRAFSQNTLAAGAFGLLIAVQPFLQDVPMSSSVETKETARIEVGGKSLILPVLTGSEGEKAIDIQSLRKETGCVTLDPGYGNTGACVSSITFLDGEVGILRHRGYPIEELAELSSYTDVAYLLLYGELPTEAQRRVFDGLIRENYGVDPEVERVIRNFPDSAHPMATLSAAFMSMSALYSDFGKETRDGHDLTVVRLLAKTASIAAYIYRKSVGKPFIVADRSLDYAANFLHMMFGDEESRTTEFKRDRAAAMDNLLVVHADHEQNCSTSTLRMVSSSGANFFASVAGAIPALWGPLHGGANQAVMEMLERIRTEGGDLDNVMERAKSKNEADRLMGFGHRVYKTYDPRARIAKAALTSFLGHLGIQEPLVEIAMGLEKRALADEYFKKRNLYPNVDFYTGILYRAMGIPTAMFTVLFAIGRMPGWLAHLVEFKKDPHHRIGRPRQIYTGPTIRSMKG
jgi:citrate synthase